MPIEIKEVIIRTTVEKEPPSSNPDLQAKQLEMLKREVLKSCEQMLEKMMKNQIQR
jgi:hypothetical protein